MPTALKLSDDLVEAARREAKLASRSTTQQLEHWAWVGRVVERAGGVDASRLRVALAADLPFDDLTEFERAIVLGRLESEAVKSAGDTTLRDRFLAEGTQLSELDPTGKLVTHAAKMTNPKRAARLRKPKSRKP